MPLNVPLRKMLRTIPAFQTLPTQELNAVIANLNCKKYKPGDRLWRAGTHIDFMGIIQEGEIIFEYPRGNSVKRSISLGAGSFFRSPCSIVETSVSSVSAYAATEVTLYVLYREQLERLRSKYPLLELTLNPAASSPHRFVSWGKVWAITIAILIALLVWHDVADALSGILYLASNHLQARIDYRQSLNLLDYASKLNPQVPHVYNKEGYIWAERDEERLAANAFTQAVNIDGTNGPALNNLATTYFSMGLIDQAITLQQRSVQVDPNIAINRYNLGIMLTEKNDYLGAIHAFKETTRIDPSWSLPHVHLSSAYLQIENYTKAEQSARIAIQLDPTQQSAYLSLAIALYHQNKSQEALVPVRRAVEMNLDNRVAIFYQALILRDLGDHSLALLILQQLLASSPDLRQRTRIAMEIEAIFLPPLDSLSTSR